MKFYTERIKWYFKQLLPMTYVSEYTLNECDGCDPVRVVTIWKMWFGRCYNVREWRVSQES